MESSDNMWSAGEGNGRPLQYSCPENLKNSMKRQKNRTLKDELPRWVGAQSATGEECTPPSPHHLLLPMTQPRRKIQETFIKVTDTAKGRD